MKSFILSIVIASLCFTVLQAQNSTLCAPNWNGNWTLQSSYLVVASGLTDCVATSVTIVQSTSNCLQFTATQYYPNTPGCAQDQEQNGVPAIVTLNNSRGFSLNQNGFSESVTLYANGTVVTLDTISSSYVMALYTGGPGPFSGATQLLAGVGAVIATIFYSIM